MGRLGIYGHACRSGEVIATLEMLGGVNSASFEGGNLSLCYSINEFNEIVAVVKSEISKFGITTFTLEEFEKKFPYKIGDMVTYDEYDEVDQRDRPENSHIESMTWGKDTVMYKLCCGSTRKTDELRPYKGRSTADFSVKCVARNKFEIIPSDNCIIRGENGKTYLIRNEKELPKDYKSCCLLLGISQYERVAYINANNILVVNGITQIHEDILQKVEKLMKLIICRNAYWKLWDDWKPTEGIHAHYSYELYKDGRVRGSFFQETKMLQFPDAKMAATFYENFRGLIQGCKELL